MTDLLEHPIPLQDTTQSPGGDIFPGRPRRHYAALDGLRGIAILAVFFSHFNGGHTRGNWLAHLVASITDAGWMGVDLFFVLSGFLITGILIDTSTERRRVGNFYKRRALRIFPIFYGVLGALLLLTPVFHLHWRSGHLLYFFFLSNMMPVLAPHLQPPGFGVDLVHLWSLAVEEQFYLLWPIIVWYVAERRHLLRIALSMMVVAFVARCLLIRSGVSTDIVYQLLVTRADSLLCGSALALWTRGPRPHHPPVRAILCVSGLITLAIFVIQGNGRHNSSLIATVGYSIIAIFCTALIYSGLQDGSLVQRVCSHIWLRFFGRYSYGLYLYHGVLIVFLVPSLPVLQRLLHSYVWGGVTYILLSLALCLGIAMISFHYVEAPILRLKKRFAS